MIATVILKLNISNISLPPIGRRFAQLLSGSFIGFSMTLNDVMALKTLFVPALILLVFYVANCIFTGYVLHKKFGFDLREGMFASSPAGATDMALIAQDVGINSPRLVVIQVSRLILVISLFPQIIKLVLTLYN